MRVLHIAAYHAHGSCMQLRLKVANALRYVLEDLQALHGPSFYGYYRLIRHYNESLWKGHKYWLMLRLTFKWLGWKTIDCSICGRDALIIRSAFSYACRLPADLLHISMLKTYYFAAQVAHNWLVRIMEFESISWMSLILSKLHGVNCMIWDLVAILIHKSLGLRGARYK